MFFSAGLLVSAEWNDKDASGDVLIQIIGGAQGGYRFSCDIVYYSMTFAFEISTYETIPETGETRISEGAWLMDENEMTSVDLTVENHSDTPICVTAFVEQGDFEACETTVAREGLQKTVIPACELTDKGVIIGESTMTLSLENYPAINDFKGEKQFYVAVCVEPTSGYTTGGSYFTYD